MRDGAGPGMGEEYGRPVSRRGRGAPDTYDPYVNGASNPDDDYDFGYSGYGH